MKKIAGISVLIILLIIIILISCNTGIDAKHQDSYIVVDLNEALINNNQNLSGIFEEARFVLRDTASNAIFGNMSSLKMVEDTLYIFDREQTRFVYKFKKNLFLDSEAHYINLVRL